LRGSKREGKSTARKREQAKNVHTMAKLDDVRRRALLNQKAPIELLKKRGILRGKTPAELEQEVLELFEIATLEDEPAFAAAAKRANHQEELSMLQRAWFACVRREARLRPPSMKYSRSRLIQLADSLSRTLQTPGAFAKLPGLFAVAGVRLVYVEALPSAKIDGGSMFVDGYPVIGLSGRGKRLDKVLFTLLHEIGHILLEHVDADHYIVEDLEDQHDRESAKEKAANQDAAGRMFPGGFPSVPARINGPWVEAAAAALGVAPIVVIGQLQHRRRLDWRTTLAKNAPAVAHVLQTWQ
jgi:HTH-type transcriptional regulator/antitoxin HigA